MANFSTDEDLLKMEPELFRVHYHHSQEIAYGTDGVIKHSDSAVIFSSATGDFVHGGVASGHVMWLAKSSDSVLYYDAAYPVKSLATSTSVLLEAKATPAVPTASSITYRISTFDPQHEDAHFLLMDMNEIDDDDLNTQNDEADLYNRRQLREASACKVLETFMMGQSTGEDDLYWQKSTHYYEKFGRALARLKLKWDPDGDSDPDRVDIRASVDLVVDDAGDDYPTGGYTGPEDL